jgi:hypothetical protein
MLFIVALNGILLLVSAVFLLSKDKVVFVRGGKFIMCLGLFVQSIGLLVANAIQGFDLSSYFTWMNWSVVFTYAFLASPIGSVLVSLAIIFAVMRAKSGSNLP